MIILFSGCNSNNSSGKDKNPPEITIIGSTNIEISIGGVYTDPGANAFDDKDGDISNRIKTNNTVNTNSVGTYTICYNVNDSSGKSAQEKIRTVRVTNPNNWTNVFAREKYKEAALALCANHDPKYLGLGIEINSYYEMDPLDFDRYVNAYKDIYNAVKNSGACPGAMVFATFQLEKMKGLGTGVGFPGKSQWELFQKFEGKLDLIVFTSYPEFEYTDPGLIPADYYSGIFDNLPDNLKTKKLGLSETGWNSSQNLLPGAANTIAIQSDFISRIAVITNDLKDAGKLEFLTWIFLHDFQIGAFMVGSSFGLKTNTGVDKEISPGYTMVDHFLGLKSVVPPFTIGAAPIPKNFPGAVAADYIDMYGIINGNFHIMTAQQDWRDSIGTSGQIPSALQAYYDAREILHVHDAVLLYGLNFFDPGTGEASLTMPDVRE